MTRLIVILVLVNVLAAVLAWLNRHPVPVAEPPEPVQTDSYLEDVWLSLYERKPA